MIDLLQISFFSRFVCCGLAVLRNTKFSLLKYIYICGFFTAFTFNGLNSITDTFIAGIVAGFIAAATVGVFHRKGKHSYLFIVIPVIYCIGPGGAMYKAFLALFNWQVATLPSQIIFIIKDAFGIWSGILAGTKIMNLITKKEVEIIS